MNSIFLNSVFQTYIQRVGQQKQSKNLTRDSVRKRRGGVGRGENGYRGKGKGKSQDGETIYSGDGH